MAANVSNVSIRANWGAQNTVTQNRTQQPNFSTITSVWCPYVVFTPHQFDSWVQSSIIANKLLSRARKACWSHCVMRAPPFNGRRMSCTPFCNVSRSTAEPSPAGTPFPSSPNISKTALRLSCVRSRHRPLPGRLMVLRIPFRPLQSPPSPLFLY